MASILWESCKCQMVQTFSCLTHVHRRYGLTRRNVSETRASTKYVYVSKSRRESAASWIRARQHTNLHGFRFRNTNVFAGLPLLHFDANRRTSRISAVFRPSIRPSYTKRTMTLAQRDLLWRICCRKVKSFVYMQSNLALRWLSFSVWNSCEKPWDQCNSIVCR